MATIKPLEFRWGIISTGGIAEKFVNDLIVDPTTRGVHDVVHKVAAVASRTLAKAEEFTKRLIPNDTSVKAYGSYTELFADKNVDAIYIGTPHTQHYENALEGIKAGKHVLCEKPATINAPELRALLAAAKEHNVFFMEAMWTRFQPLTLEVKKIAEEGTLGLPVLLHADLSGDFDIHNMPLTDRILDPMLAGGALLDIGPYPLFWAILALYENPANGLTQPTQVRGSMVMTPITPVDSAAVFSVAFGESKLKAQASLTCSITIDSYDPGVIIRFEKGNIFIKKNIFCPKEFTVQYKGKDGEIEKEETKTFQYTGKGWHFQADEVARCVRDGKLQSELWGHDKSLLEMTIFDEVRKQGGYVYPPGLEKVVDKQ